MTEQSARRMVKVLLEHAVSDVNDTRAWCKTPTEGLRIREERVNELTAILAAFDAPATTLSDNTTYQDIVTGIFRHNDVHKGSSFTHEACIRMMHSAIEAADLRFHGEMDKWVRTIGAGISGYQPEAYIALDMAMDELVRLRGKLKAIGELLP